MDANALPFAVARLPKRRLALGLATSALGYAGGAVVIIAGIAAMDAGLGPDWLGLVVFGLGLGFAAVWAQRLDARGRKLRQRDALSVLARDDRDPVLFLRSFADEHVVDLTSRTGRVHIHRAEESVCHALRRVGPVVAIGRPGERLPEVGAARLYVGERDWQGAIRFFLARAGAVVVVVGRSSGVWWEIRAALELADLTRLLFFFPFAAPALGRGGLGPGLKMRWLSAAAYREMERERDERFAVFRERIGPTVAAALPATLGTSQFVDFIGQGRPRLLATARPATLDSVFQVSFTNSRIGIHFERTLGPFVEKLLAKDRLRRA